MPVDQMKLANVKSAKRTRPPRILLLGTHKIGKSTFACSSEKPVVIPVIREEGIDDMDADAFPVCDDYLSCKFALEALEQGEHEYRTVVIDSVSALQPLVMKFSIDEEQCGTEAKLGGGFGRQYDTPLLKWSDLLRKLDNLRNQGVATILIGHVTTTKHEDPVNGSYSRYDLDLPQKIREMIYRWADVILFADWTVYRDEEESGFGAKKHRGRGDGSRKLFTQKRPSHPGGGRGVYGRLPYELPLEWSAFIKRVSKVSQGAKKDGKS